MFYSLVTQFLGYAFNEDEYKVMGLASFGDPGRYRAVSSAPRSVSAPKAASKFPAWR